jgi:hypothetical protein
MTAGILLYPASAALAKVLLRDVSLASLVPLLRAAAGLTAVVWHAASWKARCLHRHGAQVERGAAVWQPLLDGLRLGARCVRGCAGLTVALLAAGMMDWRVSVGGAFVVLAERLLAANFSRASRLKF